MSSDNHNYDGIEEHDNPLPNWWVATFIGTIIFAGIYSLHSLTHAGPTLLEEYEMEMKALPHKIEKLWTEEDLSTFFSEPDKFSEGKVVFAAKCFACHGSEGQGIIGPNLTDKYWIHGKGQRKDIFQVVQKGIIANGMPAWSEVLNEKELLSVSAFTFSLKGKTPANPKSPQGIEITE